MPDDNRTAPPSTGALKPPDAPPAGEALPTTAPAPGAARASTRVKLTELAPQAIDRIREGYADGEPVAQIKAGHNISHATLYACLDGAIPGRPRLPSIPRRKVRLGKAPESDIRSLLIAKLWRTAKRQVSEIETRLKSVAQQPSERESETRSLAVLIKALRELSALDNTQDGTRRNKSTDAVDDDPIPQDIDEFRRELARRMDAFVVAQTGSEVPDK